MSWARTVRGEYRRRKKTGDDIEKATICYVAIALLAMIAFTVVCASIARAEERLVYPAVGDYLRARYGPGSQYEEMYRLYPGDGVKLLAIEGEWASVEVAGDVCYVSVYFLSDVDTAGTPWAATVQSNGRVIIRNAPDGAATGKYAKDGQPVQVYGIRNGYAKIDAGWVSTDYLRMEE